MNTRYAHACLAFMKLKKKRIVYIYIYILKKYFYTCRATALLRMIVFFLIDVYIFYNN